MPYGTHPEIHSIMLLYGPDTPLEVSEKNNLQSMKGLEKALGSFRKDTFGIVRKENFVCVRK